MYASSVSFEGSSGADTVDPDDTVTVIRTSPSDTKDTTGGPNLNHPESVHLIFPSESSTVTDMRYAPSSKVWLADDMLIPYRVLVMS